jgi:hypothetical protein
MKTRSCFMVRCIVQDRVNVEKDLGDVISAIVCKHFPDSIVLLTIDMMYPKTLNRRELIYNISNISSIKVSDFIKIFDVEWSYSVDMVFDEMLNRSLYEEDALWSVLCNPEEVFLIPEVTWVNVYTWHG